MFTRHQVISCARRSREEIQSRSRSLFTRSAAACGLAAAFATATLQAVEFVNPEYYRRPDGVIDVTYMSPNLLRPSNNIMAKIGSQSGVLVAPNWILYASHGVSLAENYANIWIGGTQYRLSQNAVLASGADLALLKIETMSDTIPNLPYVGIDPGVTVAAGTKITQGGYGNHIPRDPVTGAPTGGPVVGGNLRWGRNALTAVGSSLSYTYGNASDIPYEGYGIGNDSGGGWFVRDGWDWRLVGITQTQSSGPSTISSANYNWIAATLGADLPALSYASKPASNVAWIGAANATWGSLTNWEDLDTPGANNKLPTAADVVEITTISGPQVGTSVTAAAKIVHIGRTTVNPAQASKLTISSGGQLTAVDVFAGTAAGEYGRIDITGGSITAENQYIGQRGRGAVSHTGGTNNSDLLVVGKENNGVTADYTLTGAASAGSAPIVNAGALVIADDASSYGSFTISGNSHATLNAQTTIVGKEGAGIFNQEKGQHTVTGALILGEKAASEGAYFLSSTGALTTNQTLLNNAGIGWFQQTGGTHTTTQLLIGSNDDYELSGGALTARNIQNSGQFEIYGGTITTNSVTGVVDFNSSSASIHGQGIANFTGATFQNNASANLTVDANSLILLASANTFGTTTQVGGLQPHVVGSTLAMNGAGFIGSGSVPDAATMTNGAFAATTGGFAVFQKGVRIQSTTAAPVTASLTGTTNILSSIAVIAHGTNVGLEVESGATLRVQGMILLANASTQFKVGGSLEVGGELGAAAIGKATIYPGVISGSPQVVFSSGSELEINVDRSVSLPGTPIISDVVDAPGAIVSIAGALTLTELTGFQAAPKETFTFLTAGAGSLSGVFSSISIDDGDPLTSGIFTSTSGGGAAYAVTYAGSSASARISLPGDINLDDIVDSADMSIWSTNYGLSSASWADGDSNGDGFVDGGDFFVIQTNFGRSWPSILAVPEPQIAALLAQTAIIAAVNCRKRVAVKRLSLVGRA